MKQQIALPVAVIMGITGGSYADGTADLDEIQVVAKEEKKTTGEIKKSRRVIQDELIADTKDLVRYTTDVGISDSGRHNKGFAMRGVEGNRVGISIDGVSLPDSEENSLYARYGNFNSSRILIDPELVKGIDIIRGSDSFNLGSGSLGGGVSYRTLDAMDIVQDGKEFGALFKSGYASKNREWIYTSGVAYKNDKLEAVGLYSHRRGHELKSLGNGSDVYGPERGIVDPSRHKNHNYLAKLAYLFADKHRFSVSYSGHNHNNYTDERSYAYSGWRETEDVSLRDNLNLAYEFFPLESKLAYAKLEYDYQKTRVSTYNYKGYLDSNSGQKNFDELYDRGIYTKFHRVSGRLDSSAFDALGATHQITFRTGISRHNFENSNIDYSTFGTTYYSIQHPVRTKQFYASLQDQLQWTDKFSTVLGARYDYTKVIPQSLIAPCYACFKTVPSSVTFESLSGNIGLDYRFNDTWKGAYNISSGYRIPSASEMFFTYKHPSGNWLANPKLKPERSLHQSLSLQGEGNYGTLFVHLYRTDYKDFLYEKETRAWWINRECDAHCIFNGGKVVNETLFQQAVNFDRAKIYGVEVTGKLNLDNVTPYISKGWNVMGAIGYSKGKLSDGNVSLLSIQPLKVILGFGYDDPKERWGIQSRWTYLGEKKAKDAQILTYYYDPRGKTQAFPYLNGSAVLFDTYGFIKVSKNIMLRAGVYNIFNRKYHTWDSLRGINFRGTTNTVDRDKKGLERYYAPGRNFAISAEVKF
ncbi:TonB-dependent hemoglobin/transferrin/lactoferrin family receptor [Ursidibacter arcticus]